MGSEGFRPSPGSAKINESLGGGTLHEINGTHKS